MHRVGAVHMLYIKNVADVVLRFAVDGILYVGGKYLLRVEFLSALFFGGERQLCRY